LKTKSREYLRELNQTEIKNLKGRYANHVKSKRDGYLNTKQKERLLRIIKWGRDTTDRDITDFFYEIRERATTAIRDLQLLCEVLSENQLEKIFLKKDVHPYEDKKLETISYPISELMEALLPHPIFAREQTKEFMEKYMQERQWRKYILENLVIESLTWYFNSDLFKTNAQKQLLFNTIDAIQVNSSGKKSYDLDYKLGGKMSLITF